MLSQSLNQALERLDDFSEVFIRKIEFLDNEKIYSIYFSTHINGLTRLSDDLYWYCNVHEDYPYGSITIRPCRLRGLKSTYPHQNLNTESIKSPWTNGKICLDHPYDMGTSAVRKTEPRVSTERLGWHFSRLIDWIKDADKDQLLKDGDPFEIPDFDVYVKRSWGFVGSLNELEAFSEYFNKQGYFQYVPTSGRLFNIILNFTEFSGKGIYSLEGVEVFKDYMRTGVWVLLDNVPVVSNWQSPQCYEELIGILTAKGIDFESILKRIVKKGKNKELINSIAIGFPISEKVGEDPKAIHWQILELPMIEIKPNGYRDKVSSIVSFNKIKNFFPSKKLNWSRSVNINHKYLFSRVPEYQVLSSQKICIIGAGSLGSIFAESLVRSGVQDLSLIDFDLFREGNLCRHVLTVDDLDHFKVTQLENRLMKINPFLRVEGIRKSIDEKFEIRSLNDFDIVIDFTASDHVLHIIEKNKEVLENKLFFSFSFGVNASPVFCLLSKLNSLDLERFYTEVQNLKDEWTEGQQISEGIGCWNPVFPAPVFLVQNAANVAFQFLMTEMKKNEEFKVSVYQNIYKNGEYEGIRKIK